jgi:hypothetical protein
VVKAETGRLLRAAQGLSGTRRTSGRIIRIEPSIRPAAAFVLRVRGGFIRLVEGLFAKLTRQRLKRGVFRSIVELQVAIHRFLAETNGAPKPFVWTKSADDILAAAKRGRQALESIH